MGMNRIEIETDLKLEDTVQVVNGPFKDMFGKIRTIDVENAKLEVALDLFGQETLVELGINEIEKV